MILTDGIRKELTSENAVCTTDPTMGDDGIAMICVPYPIKGVSFGKFENKAGMQTDRNCTIYFDDVRVPKRYRAAGQGDYAILLHQNLILGSGAGAAMSGSGADYARNCYPLHHGTGRSRKANQGAQSERLRTGLRASVASSDTSRALIDVSLDNRTLPDIICRDVPR